MRVLMQPNLYAHVNAQPKVQFGNRNQDHYQEIQQVVDEMTIGTKPTPAFHQQYQLPTYAQSFFDFFINSLDYLAALVGLSDETTEYLREKIKESSSNTQDMSGSRKVLVDLLQAVDKQVRVTGHFNPRLQRQAGKAVLDLLLKTAEEQRPFYYITELMNNPALLNSHEYLLTALKDHPSIALKPGGLLSNWNSLISPQPVEHTLKQRRLLAYHLMHYIKRASHETMILSQLDAILRDSLNQSNRAFSPEELLCVRNLLHRMPDSPEIEYLKKQILKPTQDGTFHLVESAFKDSSTLGVISQDDQEKLQIHIQGDINIFKRNIGTALALLQRTLEPKENSSEAGQVLSKETADLKSFFLMDSLLMSLKDSTTGSHFFGLSTIFENIDFPPAILDLALNQMIDLIAPQQDRPETALTKPYRLLLAQLLTNAIKHPEQKERFQEIAKSYGILSDTTGFDPSNGAAIHRRMDESVIGLTEVKQSLSQQWESHFKALKQNKELKTRPIIFLDGANGTGKTSTLRRFAMELHTDQHKQKRITAHDYWYGDANGRYDQDFGVIITPLTQNLDNDLDMENIQNGALEKYLIDKVNTLVLKLKNTSGPRMLVFDELSKAVANMSDPEAKKTMSNAIAGMIVDLATKGKYQVPKTNVTLSLPPDTFIGLTGNFSVRLIQDGQSPEDIQALKSEVLKYPFFLQTENGKKLAELLQDKTFMTGRFSTEDVSKLVDSLIQQYLPYITALKGARVSFQNPDELQKYFMTQHSQKALDGRSIANTLERELFQGLAIDNILPGSTVKITFKEKETQQLGKLSFQIEKVPPEQDLTKI